MPRKTLKQKIHADARFKSWDMATFSYQAKPLAESPQTEEISAAYDYVRKDIFKTVLLGSLFIVVEVLLAANSRLLGW